MGYVAMFILGMMMGSVVLWLLIDTMCYIAPKKERKQWK
jgi:hypothetical protein